MCVQCKCHVQRLAAAAQRKSMTNMGFMSVFPFRYRMWCKMQVNRHFVCSSHNSDTKKSQTIVSISWFRFSNARAGLAGSIWARMQQYVHCESHLRSSDHSLVWLSDINVATKRQTRRVNWLRYSNGFFFPNQLRNVCVDVTSELSSSKQTPLYRLGDKLWVELDFGVECLKLICR